jgi:thiol-disulfide isomerase/thioredoxin
MNKDETGTSQDSMPKSDAGMQKDSMMAKHGSYKDYSADVVMAEQAAGQKVVLFFHAVWCPYCQAADKVFKDHPENIPAGISVLKTDYDSNTALKEKYGVNYQHTFVQIDNQGNLVTKWVSGDTDLLAKNIK